MSCSITQEEVRQEENDKLRKEFAKFANAFYHWLTDSRYSVLLGDAPDNDFAGYPAGRIMS